jgi:glutamyl-tRNA reductase
VVVTAAAVRAAMLKRPARPLFFIDQALPRDVDPGVSEIENVFLYNRAARAAEIAKCRAIVAEKSDAVWRHIAGQVAALAEAAGAKNEPAAEERALGAAADI